MKAYIYFNSRSKGLDYDGEGEYVLVTEDDRCIIMEFVTYGILKKLKDKGYPLQATHDKNVSRLIYEPPRENEDWKDCDVFYVPMISEILGWLRDSKAIHIHTDLWQRGWYCDVRSYKYNEEDDEYDVKNEFQSENYESYYKATIAGIKYVLDNLI